MTAARAVAPLQAVKQRTRLRSQGRRVVAPISAVRQHRRPQAVGRSSSRCTSSPARVPSRPSHPLHAISTTTAWIRERYSSVPATHRHQQPNMNPSHVSAPGVHDGPGARMRLALVDARSEDLGVASKISSVRCHGRRADRAPGPLEAPVRGCVDSSEVELLKTRRSRRTITLGVESPGSRSREGESRPCVLQTLEQHAAGRRRPHGAPRFQRAGAWPQCRGRFGPPLEGRSSSMRSMSKRVQWTRCEVLSGPQQAAWSSSIPSQFHSDMASLDHSRGASHSPESAPMSCSKKLAIVARAACGSRVRPIAPQLRFSAASDPVRPLR